MLKIIELALKFIVDNGVCRTCRGRAKYMTRTVDEKTGEVSISWRFCEDCNGTGYERDGDGDFSLN